MNYQMVGSLDTQKPSWIPFQEWILPTDLDLAKKAIQDIIEADNPGGPINPANWMFVGYGLGPEMLLGGTKIEFFLVRYVLYARKIKDYITPSTFMKFRSGLKGEYPEFKEEGLNVWLNAMIEASESGQIPNSVLKPYTVIPDTTPLATVVKDVLKKTAEIAGEAASPVVNRILLYAAIGGTAYLIFTYGIPTLIRKGTHYAGAKQSRKGSGIF